jgi:hypothetical protein
MEGKILARLGYELIFGEDMLFVQAHILCI